MKYEDYNLTEKQIEACKEVAKAIKKARKLGVAFHVKAGSLTAYQNRAFYFNQVCEPHETSWNADRAHPVPFYNVCDITSSEGDDAFYFIKGIFNNE